MLEKTYQPNEIEPRIHDLWTEADAFSAGRADRVAQPGYCIVIPPPNVTGSLHMGHALNITLQDVLCRFERMRGKDVLWQPGTDHAGIATQMVVERQLRLAQQPDRRALGRAKFLEKVWTWKAESGGTIINQLKRLGASCDWERERFTMDPALSAAVIEIFVKLHDAGLIYKANRLVNWDPKLLTGVSDLEVEAIETTGSFKWSYLDKDKEGLAVEFQPSALAKVLDRNPNGHLYYLRYPIAGRTFDALNTETFIVVATTRPETMLGDTGVAVNPKDKRYTALIGQACVLPLVGRSIPIVGDAYSDPEKGTGAVKMTPAHDFNDFEVGRRHALREISIFTHEAALSLKKNEAFLDGASPAASVLALDGADRFEARRKITDLLAAGGYLVKIEPTTQAVPHGDRSGVPIEPMLSEQWYVDVKPLADRAMTAVRDGKTRIIPARGEADFFRWLENIQPWNISRQLWWGHQIPAWYGPDGTYVVARDEAEAQIKAQAKWGTTVALKRDEDVLDTWFSSALWPYSTLGWPEKTPELAKFYPNSALVTGADILFFWVARMMMTGLFVLDEVPFRDVYLHGLVRDEKGVKMSKTKGNVMDPLDIIDGTDLPRLLDKRTRGMEPADAKRIDKETRNAYPNGIERYGADALRFCLAAMAAQGRDPKLSVKAIEGYRNFATKLWNAARFAEQNECVRQRGFNPKTSKAEINRWIAGEVETCAKAVTEGIVNYRFNDAANAIYAFTWGTFCDWYLELSKPILRSDDAELKAETRATTAWVLDQILKLLHPFMPFITEELWGRMVEVGEERQSLLCHAQWPVYDGLIDADARSDIGWLVKLVSDIRSVRSEMNVPAGARVPLVLVGAAKATMVRVERHEETILLLGRIDKITFAKSPPKASAQIVVDETTACLALDGIIDMAAERQRLEKEIASSTADLGKMTAKLDNPAFMAKAKEDAIEEARERKDELLHAISKLDAAVKRLLG